MAFQPRRGANGSFVVAGVAAVLLAATANAPAQEFPEKPARMIVPFAPGGGADFNARRLSDQLSERWKQPVVVHNMGGGGGNVALAATAASEPTGYTMLFASLAIIVNNPTLYSNLSFDPDKDLTPVALIGEVPLVLMVNADLPAKDLASFIALAKQRPVHFGSGGVGTSMHLAGELLNAVAGIKMVHIPYKGAGVVVAAIMANEVQMIMQNVALAEGQIKGGRLKVLAAASPKRLAMLPNVPTFAESGLPDYRAAISYGIYVRAGTPAPVIAALNRSINAVLDDPAYRKQMSMLGMELAGGTPQQLAAYVAAERKKWVPILRTLGIKAN
ncbi:MAG: tripartite tricarboxylate transporter substrate binding protein [Gammaproteobacteria bacterium]|nr:tripartite tricarboxylate transporter substrate binding protein [Gammaproteobacteria bacterium]